MTCEFSVVTGETLSTKQGSHAVQRTSKTGLHNKNTQ